MRFFKPVLVDSPGEVPSFLDELPNQHRGWLTDFDSTIPIHPFFRKEMFFNVNFFDERDKTFKKPPISNGDYNNLVPALRLASAMLEKSRNYWVFILEAWIYDDSRNPARRKPRWDFNYVNQNLRQRWPRVDRELRLMARNTQICWFNPEDDPDDNLGSFTYGITNAFNKPRLSADRGQSNLRFRIAICDVLYTALNDSNFDRKPWVKRHIVYINIATSLVHELAHCLYLHRCRDLIQEEWTMDGELDGEIGDFPEPRIDTAPYQEIGFLFERYLFGGKLQHTFDYQQHPSAGMNHLAKIDGSTGLNFHLYTPDGTSQCTDYEVSEETILMLLHERTWRSNVLEPMYLLPLEAFTDDDDDDEYDDDDDASDYDASEY